MTVSDLPRDGAEGYVEGTATGTASPGPEGGPAVVWWQVEVERGSRTCTGSERRNCRTTHVTGSVARSSPTLLVDASGTVVRVPVGGLDVDDVADLRTASAGGARRRVQTGLVAGTPVLVVGRFTRSAPGEAVLAPDPDAAKVYGGTRAQVLGRLDDLHTAVVVVAVVLAVLTLAATVLTVLAWRRWARSGRLRAS